MQMQTWKILSEKNEVKRFVDDALQRQRKKFFLIVISKKETGINRNKDWNNVPPSTKTGF